MALPLLRTRGRVHRTRPLVAAATGLAILASASCTTAGADTAAAPSQVTTPADLTWVPPAEPEPEPTVARELDPHLDPHLDPDGEPTRIVIPAIDVDADLVRLGLNGDRSMQVPEFGLAGWYSEGPTPGGAGPSVVVAHVDSRTGPDVFHRLGDLAAGDEVHVEYDSGDEVVFVVDASDQTPKDQLPVDAIWPTTDERLLTLITCGGSFDRSVGHYRDNIVVYTSSVRRTRQPDA